MPPAGYVLVSGNNSGNMMFYWGVNPGGEVDATFRLKRGQSASVLFLEPDGVTPVVTNPFQVIDQTNNRSVPEYTNDKGRATVTLLADTSNTLQMDHVAGWARHQVSTKAGKSVDEQTIVLREYSRIKGRIADTEGKPIPEVAVTVTEVTAGQNRVRVQWSNRGPGNMAPKSAEDGSFVIERVAGTSITLTGEPPTGSVYTASEPVPVELVPGETREGIVLTMGSGATITITVTDDAGNPVENASANWATVSSGRYMQNNGSVMSDKEGKFRIGGLTESIPVSNLSVSKIGHQSAYRNQLRLLEGDATIVLQRDAGLTVAAVDEVGGSPIKHYDYLVYATAWDQWSHDGKPVRVKDEDGIAKLTVSAGTGKRIVVAELDDAGVYTGRKGAATFSVPPPGQPRQVIVPVGPGATIRGVVVQGTSEEPVEGAVVRQMDARWGNASPAPSVFAVPSATTDSKGRFEIADLQEGTYELLATLGDVTTPEATTVEIGRDKAAPDEVRIVLTEGGSIEGTVIGRDGKPMAGLTINANPTQRGGGNPPAATTDKEGNFSFKGLAAGRYNVSFSTSYPQFRMSKTVEVQAGEPTRWDVDLSKLIEVTGKITLNGKPWAATGPPYFAAAAASEVGMDWAKLTPDGAGGKYKLMVIPDTYGLRLAGGGVPIRVGSQFEVPAEPAQQTRDFEIMTAAVDVAVEMPSGEVFRQGNLTFDTKVGEAIEEGTANDNIEGERRRIEFFAPGTHRVRYRSWQDNFEGESDWVTVRPGADNVFVIFARSGERTLNAIGRVQQQLTNLGYDPGPVDGLIGPMTRNAIRGFQEDQKLPVNGQPDDPQLGPRLDELAPLKARGH
jgi:protocatechuate 3,4-dioxygenase beta subunit